MTQATPGPWTIGPNGRSIIKEVPGIADGYDHYMIAVLSAHSLIGDQEARANATLIVRAVNERPELIAALETTIGNLMNVQIDLSTGGTEAKADKSLSEIITRAVAILEKAKAQ